MTGSLDRLDTVLLLLVLVLALLYLRQSWRAKERAQSLFESWRESAMELAMADLSRSLELQSETALERWKLDHELAIRKDALKRSQAVIAGKATEHLVPFLPEFPFDPKDARFLGSPVDLIVFDGMSSGEIREIVFVEVKTGAAAALSTRERRIRDAVLSGRIAWRELRIPI